MAVLSSDSGFTDRDGCIFRDLSVSYVAESTLASASFLARSNCSIQERNMSLLIRPFVPSHRYSSGLFWPTFAGSIKKWVVSLVSAMLLRPAATGARLGCSGGNFPAPHVTLCPSPHPEPLCIKHSTPQDSRPRRRPARQ